ncbi:MAG: AtpZ/AtpI family protein, partial [Geminicoccaceae bacterium]
AQSANESGKGRTESDAAEERRIEDRLADLDARLGSVKTRDTTGNEAERRGNALGLAFRITTELVAGVVVGGLIGWQLDRWLDTSPVLLLVFFGLGVAAGILNVVRTAHEMQRKSGGAGEDRPSSGSPPDET